MNLQSRSLITLLFSVLPMLPVAPAAAQFEQDKIINGGLSGGGGAVDQIVHGDFNGDTVVDYAVLQGRTVTLIISPELLESSYALEGSFLSIAAVPGALGSDLMTTSAAGLQRHAFHDATGGWAPITTTLSTAWAGYDSLETYTVGPNRTFLAAMLGRDLKSGFLQDQVFTDSPYTVTATAGVSALCLADLDDDGMAEFVTGDPSGLHAYYHHGASFGTIPHAGATHQLETVDLANKDGIAWLRRAPSGLTDQIVVLNAASSTLPQTLVGFVASGMIVGDVDGDGTRDFGLIPALTQTMRLYVQEAGQFDLSSPDVLDLPAGVDRNAMGFADNDGDGDLFLVYPASGQIQLLDSDLEDHTQITPTLNFGAGSYYKDDDPEERVLLIDLELSPVIPAEATHVETVLWSTLVLPDAMDPAVPVGVTEPTPFRRFLTPLSEIGSVQALELPGFLEGTFEGSPVPVESLMQHYTVRYVTTAGGTAPVTKSWHAAVYHCHIDEQPLLDAYAAIWATGGESVLNEGPAPGVAFAFHGTGNEAGNSCPGACVPGPPPTKPPPTNTDKKDDSGSGLPAGN